MALNSEKTSKVISRLLLTVIVVLVGIGFLYLLQKPIRLQQDLDAKQVIIDTLQSQHKRDSSQLANILQMMDRGSKGKDTILYENRMEKRRYMIQFQPLK